MACKPCAHKPETPFVRRGLPTIYAWGPFLDHKAVDYTDEKYDATIQEEG